MTEQYEQPELPFEGGIPGANGIDLKAHVGCAALIVVGGTHPEMSTRFGVKPAVRGGLVILNGPDAGKEYLDALFFATRVVRSLRGHPGKATVWHVDIDNTTTQPAVELLEPSADELELARKWHAANPNRINELIGEMTGAFNAASAGVTVREQPRQQQQPARSAPPTGPNYGRTGPPPSEPPRSAPPREATWGDVLAAPAPLSIPADEPPF